MLVADCDGEPSVVGPDDLDELALLVRAGDVELRALAAVGGLVLGAVGTLT